MTDRGAEPVEGEQGRHRLPMISVVVPTKGRPRYLVGCLRALAASDHPRERFEVVVVNDGGGAAVEGVVAGFERELALALVRPERTGPSAARNAGARAAAGHQLAFTDDDCEPTRGWLAALARALAANPGAGVGGVTVNGAPHDRGAVASQLVVDALHEHFNRDASAPRFFASSNLALPASDFRAIGGFGEELRYAEDRDLCERWLASGRTFAQARDAVVHHMRTLSLTEFWGQHHGYGRGAWAYARARPTASGKDRAGVMRALARRAGRRRAGGGLPTAGYLALSQLATASGFAREALAARAAASRPAR